MIWNRSSLGLLKEQEIYFLMKDNSFDPAQGENKDVSNLTVQFGLTKEINVGAQSNM